MSGKTKWSTDRYLQVEENGTLVLYDKGAGRDADKKREQMLKRKKRKTAAKKKKTAAKKKTTKRKKTTNGKYLGFKDGKRFYEGPLCGVFYIANGQKRYAAF